jgi:hypothetical protein
VEAINSNIFESQAQEYDSGLIITPNFSERVHDFEKGS